MYFDNGGPLNLARVLVYDDGRCEFNLYGDEDMVPMSYFDCVDTISDNLKNVLESNRKGSIRSE